MRASVVVISKNDVGLGETLSDLDTLASDPAHPLEVIVVDASDGALDEIRAAHPAVNWIAFRSATKDSGITIPEQRNVGVAAASGEVVVFTDAGCRLDERWLPALLAPFEAGRGGERGDGDAEVCVVGVFGASGAGSHDIYSANQVLTRAYVEEAPTLNFAVRRSTIDEVGGFDELFDYGSDVDLCWRLGEHGHKILRVPEALVLHSFDDAAAQRRRARRYGGARARLYDKHRHQLPAVLRRDPILVVYTVLILLTPLFLLQPLLLGVLALPLWRGRGSKPVATLVDHLLYGYGALAYLSARPRAESPLFSTTGARACARHHR